MFLMATVYRNNKQKNIFSNDVPPGYKSLRKILKTAFITMYGPTYHKHFVNSTSVSTIKSFTSKDTDKITNFECLPWFEN